MNVPSRASTEVAVRILESARKKGVNLWVEGDQLRYQAPKGSLTTEDIEKLRTQRAQIMFLLTEASVGDSEIGLGRVPAATLPLSHFRNWHTGTSVNHSAGVAGA